MIQIKALVYNSFQVNTFILWDDPGNCLVVDPAFHSEEERSHFDRFISEKGLVVNAQINTHSHVDHVLGVGYIRSRYRCPFRAHAEESRIANNVPLMGDMYGLTVEPLPVIEQVIEDNEEIMLGDHSLRAIHVPGHSPGSLAFYSGEGGFVITGDALFQGSIGRTDLPGGNYEQLIQSIRTRLLVLPPETAVFPGHGPSSTIGHERNSNPFLSMSQ